MDELDKKIIDRIQNIIQNKDNLKEKQIDDLRQIIFDLNHKYSSSKAILHIEKMYLFQDERFIKKVKNMIDDLTFMRCDFLDNIGAIRTKVGFVDGESQYIKFVNNCGNYISALRKELESFLEWCKISE